MATPQTTRDRSIMPEVSLLSKLLHILKTSSLFHSFPLSILLIGLEALMDQHFSCPCDNDLNKKLTLTIFIGPVLFTFCLMYFILRPFKHKSWFSCPVGENDKTPGPQEAKGVYRSNLPTALTSCLIPPVMWIFILFLDGDYFACSIADCDGFYVFDEELKISWCKPISEENNQSCRNSHGNIQDTVINLHWSKVIQSLS